MFIFVVCFICMRPHVLRITVLEHCIMYTAFVFFEEEKNVNFRLMFGLFVWEHMKKSFQSNVKTRYAFLVSPEVTTTTTTTTAPTMKPDRSQNNRMNKSVPACVLAIVNCCSKYDEVVRTPCFEKHNCMGAFFGRGACSPDIKLAAFREVEKFSRWFYNSNFHPFLSNSNRRLNANSFIIH